jgi:hypothetical protein
LNSFKFLNICIYIKRNVGDSTQVFMFHVYFKHSLRVILCILFTVLAFDCDWPHEITCGIFLCVASYWHSKSFRFWNILDFQIKDALPVVIIFLNKTRISLWLTRWYYTTLFLIDAFISLTFLLYQWIFRFFQKFCLFFP